MTPDDSLKPWCLFCDRPRVGCVCSLDPNGIPENHWSLEDRYSKCCEACEHGYHDMPLTEDEMFGALMCDCACHNGAGIEELSKLVETLKSVLEPKGWTVDGPI